MEPTGRRKRRPGPARLLCAAVLAVLVAGAGAPAWAQDAARWPSGTEELNQGWRVQSGDNPAWAQPDFADSGWPTVALTTRNDTTGWHWYRLRTEIPAGLGPLALLVNGGDGTYEVYLNGKQLAGSRLQSAMLVTYPRSRVVFLPPAASSAVIALRTNIPATSMFLADRGSWRVSLGTLAAIDDAPRAEQSGQFDSVVLGLGVDLLLLFGGIPVLLLFWYQPDHREYLWLGCYLILCALGNSTYECSSASSLVPFSTNWFISTPANYMETLCQIKLTFCFVGRRVTRGRRIYEALLLLWPIFFILPAWHGFLSRAVFDVVEIFLLLPASLILPVLLLIWYQRGNREAVWFIVPSIFPLLTTSVADVGIIGDYFGFHRLAVYAGAEVAHV